jgi:hypothetical protein
LISLDLLLLGTVAFAVAVLTGSWLMTLRVPYPKRFAVPRGRGKTGIARSFKLALAPWARVESRAHLSPEISERFYKRSFLALHYHFAVFTALVLLIASPLCKEIPEFLAPILGALMIFGLICGLFLLFMRVFNRKLRSISIPDDYLANIIVNLLIVSAVAFAFEPKALPVFQVVGVVLLIYAPFGKIRHMVFTFTSLWFLGDELGRVGIRRNVKGFGEGKR